MNRRQFLAGAGAAAATATGYGGVRVADLRPYDPDRPSERLGSDPAPRDRVLAATRHLFAADHRARTRVRVLDDWTGDAPYLLTRHRERHEHSRRRHAHVLTTFGNGLVLADRDRDGVDPRAATPYASIDAVLHFSSAVSADPETLPERFVLHVDDGGIRVDRDAPPQSVGEPIRVNSEGYSGAAPIADFPRPMLGEPIRPHRAAWTVRERTADTLELELSGPDGYAQAVPLFSPGGVTIREDCWLRATLDRESGRLRHVVDHRDVDVDVGVERREMRRVVMRRETTFDQYGRATAPLPQGELGRSLSPLDRLRALANDLSTY